LSILTHMSKLVPNKGMVTYFLADGLLG